MSSVQERLASTSYGQLAKRVGCSKAMVSLVMRGERTPTLQLAYKIAEALKCSTEELLKHLGLIVGRAHNWMGEVRTSTVKVSRRVTEKAA